MRGNTHERVLPFTDAVTTEVNRKWSRITKAGKGTDDRWMVDEWWTDDGWMMDGWWTDTGIHDHRLRDKYIDIFNNI